MDYPALLIAIAAAHQQAQAGAAGAVNRQLILRNWLIGAHLVEFEQRGEDRAAYGDRLLSRVAADLKARRFDGLGLSMLKDCLVFYRLYPQIRQPAVGELSAPAVFAIGQPPVGQFEAMQISTTPSRKSAKRLPAPLPVGMLLRLSWTHLLELIRLDDPWKRAFYENECLKGNWSKRQLQRQIGSLLYERTGLSTDKAAVIEHARKQAAEMPGAIADLIRDPYVLEFTGLAEQPRTSAQRSTRLLLVAPLVRAGRGLKQPLAPGPVFITEASAGRRRQHARRVRSPEPMRNVHRLTSLPVTLGFNRARILPSITSAVPKLSAKTSPRSPSLMLTAKVTLRAGGYHGRTHFLREEDGLGWRYGLVGRPQFDAPLENALSWPVKRREITSAGRIGLSDSC